MAASDERSDDIFLPGGRLRQEAMTDCALSVVRDALRLARETRWDSVRSPHVFMGLLSQPDHCVRDWGDRLKADLPVDRSGDGREDIGITIIKDIAGHLRNAMFIQRPLGAEFWD